MKYFKHMETKNDPATGESIEGFLYYQPDNGIDTAVCIPDDPANSDYQKMMEMVDAGDATIEVVVD